MSINNASNNYNCGQCNTNFMNLSELMSHRRGCHPDELPSIETVTQNNITRSLRESAHNYAIRSIVFTPHDEAMLPDDFFDNAMPLFQRTLNDLNCENSECKIHAILCLKMKKLDNEANLQHESTIVFSINSQAVSSSFLETTISELLGKVQCYVNKGSNWVVTAVKWFSFRISRYYSAPQYHGHGSNSRTPMPKRLEAKRACVNVNNYNDINCFQFAVASVLHYDDISSHRNYATQYIPFIQQYKWRPELFPMNASNIGTFERDNPGIRINLLHWDDNNKEHPIRSLYQTKGEIQATDKLVIILAYDMEDSPSHYVGVVNFNRLFSSREQEQLRCERCLRPFNGRNGTGKNQAVLEAHRTACYGKFQPTTMPPKESKQFFSKWGNMQRLPYCVYADIECILQMDEKQLAKHVPAAFGFLLVPSPELKKTPIPCQYYRFVGPNCILEGMRKLENVGRQVYEWNKANSDCPIRLTHEEKHAHSLETHCFLCHGEFSNDDPLKRKVREHDHLSGKFRGSACQKCNTKARLNKTLLPIFFHNLKNYDAHHLCLDALGQLKHWTLSVIPLTSEKYLTLSGKFEVDKFENSHTGKSQTINMELAFKDSYQFLSTSLADLVKNIPKYQLHLCKTLPWSMDIVSGKGIFPYSFFDSFEKLNFPQLPAKEEFFDTLREEDISDGDYQKAQYAWKEMKCETFDDYMQAYLQMDIYQLADVFENFRTISLKEDCLDPVYYPTLPSMSWDLAFKFTKTEVDLLSDESMYDFFTKGIRGGMTFINEHHVVANTPRIPETYQSDMPLRDLLYVDANNLYGQALSMKLPKSDFHWIDENEMLQLQTNLDTMDLDGNMGFVLEVDLVYPPSLQDITQDLPLAPERAMSTDDMLTDHMRTQWDVVSEKRFGRTRPYKGTSKLLLTHWNKTKYVIHAKLLQFYLKMGMRLMKIHSGVRFQQESFFEPYISINSKCRQAATDTFSKDYYKLKNNCLFGKTMENVKNRKNFRLVNSEEQAMTLASRAEFLETFIFNENLSATLLAQETVTLNKPIFIGQAVLDLSKLVMYSLRYKKLSGYEKLFRGKIRCAGGDTD